MMDEAVMAASIPYLTKTSLSGNSVGIKGLGHKP
jgi:hypothetical protein